MSVPAPSRRGLLTAAAWTVPTVVVASAAPAYATSNAACVTATYSVPWTRANYPAPITSVQTSGIPAAGPVVALSLSSVFKGMVAFRDDRDRSANLTVSEYKVGGLNDEGLTIQQQLPVGVSSTSRARYQEVCLNFTHPVKGLSFTITDIDGTSGQYRDQIVLSPPPLPIQHMGTTGEATESKPLMSKTNSNVGVKVSGRNARVSYPADEELSAVTLTFWNGDAGKNLRNRGQQVIFITDMTFRASSC